MNKTDIRRRILKKRNNLTLDFVINAGNEIYQNLLIANLLDFESYLIYLSFKNEASTESILRHQSDNGRVVCVPKCNEQNNTFIPVLYNPMNLAYNSYGIPEPVTNDIYDGKISCAVVPGVAFDEKGNRIGFGKGYYDKFLGADSDIYKVGLCYEFQICENCMPDEFDIPMDIIITEKRIIRCK